MAAVSSRIPSSDDPPPPEAPRLRADALHNRGRILEAAREAFATRGLDVPMAAIARRAGVGVATLYRHFPTRGSLVTEVFGDQVRACASVLDEALADPDPWRGFRTAVEKVCAMEAADRGFAHALLTVYPDAIDYEGARSRAEACFADVVRRAQEAGRLRADFVPADLILLLIANNAVITQTAQAAPEASRRLFAYLLQSFRADGPAEPLPPPPALTLNHWHGGPAGRDGVP